MYALYLFYNQIESNYMQKAVFHYGESRLSIGLALEICQGKRKGLLSVAAKERILRS